MARSKRRNEDGYINQRKRRNRKRGLSREISIKLIEMAWLAEPSAALGWRREYLICRRRRRNQNESGKAVA